MTARHSRILVTFVILAAAHLSFHSQSSPAEPLLREARVSRVHDGDTVTLRWDNQRRKTRLIGIDAPEMGQRPWGGRSREHLIRIMKQNNWTVLVETDVQTTDKYNRPLAYLFTRNKVFINEQMVRDGYAVLFTIPPNVKYAELLTTAQEKARNAGAGIWGPGGLTEEPVRWREKNPRIN